MINDKDKVKMFEMRLKGCTYEEIGKVFRISRERARQILKDAISRETTLKKRKNSVYLLKNNTGSIDPPGM